MAGFQISSDRTFPASFSAFVLEGELDIAAALPMLDVLGEALARGGPITLDLSELTFIDSVGVRAIVIAVERASGDVILHGVRGVVRTALELLRIDEVENLYILPPIVSVAPVASHRVAAIA